MESVDIHAEENRLVSHPDVIMKHSLSSYVQLLILYSDSPNYYLCLLYSDSILDVPLVLACPDALTTCKDLIVKPNEC